MVTSFAEITPRQSRTRLAGRTRKRYTVSCKQLGSPENKLDSYRQANQWWTNKLADLQKLIPRPHNHELLDALASRLHWAKEHGENEQAKDLSAKLKEATTATMDDQPPLDDTSEGRKIASLFGIIIPDDLDPTVTSHFFGTRQVWQERFKRDKIKDVGQTVAAQIAEWLAEQQGKAEAKQMTPTRFNVKKNAMAHYGKFVEGMVIASVSAKLVSAYYLHCLGKITVNEWMPNTAKANFDTSREFVEWLWKQSMIELPRNIHDRFSFKGCSRAS
jgi:hypothetical protein